MKKEIKRSLLMLIGLFVFATTGLAYAFSILYLGVTPNSSTLNLSGIESNHEIITEQALLSEYTTQISSGAISFNWQAVMRISAQNRYTDSTMLLSSKVHFDEETFDEGNQRLIQMKRNIARLAFEKNYKDAQDELGAALHTVQDFYAHSNWVNMYGANSANLGMAGIDPFGDLNLISRNLPCIKSGIDSHNRYLTSGHATLKQSVSGNTDYRYTKSGTEPSTPDKCIHGNGKIASTESEGAGINKDTSRRDGFNLARPVAIAGTKQYVDDVIVTLRTEFKGGDEQVCGLLGQQSYGCQAVAAANIDPTSICPFEFKGKLSNPDSSGEWQTTMDFDNCTKTSFSGTIYLTRSGFPNTKRAFSGFYQPSGVVSVNFGDAQQSGPSPFGFYPCVGMTAQFTVKLLRIEGTWKATNCSQGGQFWLSQTNVY